MKHLFNFIKKLLGYAEPEDNSWRENLRRRRLDIMTDLIATQDEPKSSWSTVNRKAYRQSLYDEMTAINAKLGKEDIVVTRD